MGLFKKLLGGGKKQGAFTGKLGKCDLVTSKPYYVVGEMVYGTIYIDAFAQLPMDKIYIEAKGHEKLQWKEEWTTQDSDGNEKHHKEWYDENDTFFKMKILLTDPNMIGFIPAGKHAFPFQFCLPITSAKGQPLAGSFLYKEKNGGWDWSGGRGNPQKIKAKIEYSLKLVVDLEGANDLSKKIVLTIFENPTSGLVMPSDRKKAQVRLCCCIPRGEVDIQGTVNKTFFVPGEMCTAIATIKNESKSKVTPAIELNRHLKFKADHHKIHSHWMNNMGRALPMEPGEVRDVRIDFQVPEWSMPTTNGKYIHCYYILDVLTEVTMAPDIELHFPLMVFMPMIPDYVAVYPGADQYAVAAPAQVQPVEGFAQGVLPDKPVVVDEKPYDPNFGQDAAPAAAVEEKPYDPNAGQPAAPAAAVEEKPYDPNAGQPTKKEQEMAEKPTAQLLAEPQGLNTAEQELGVVQSVRGSKRGSC